MRMFCCKTIIWKSEINVKVKSGKNEVSSLQSSVYLIISSFHIPQFPTSQQQAVLNSCFKFIMACGNPPAIGISVSCNVFFMMHCSDIAY